MRNYPQAFTDESFWKKVRRFAKTAGREVVEKALTLYYCFQDRDTPAWARGVILAALGYFVLPTDVIPDVIPITGYSDDLVTLVAALATVAAHTKPEHLEKARKKWDAWFSRTSPTRSI